MSLPTCHVFESDGVLQLAFWSLMFATCMYTYGNIYICIYIYASDSRCENKPRRPF